MLHKKNIFKDFGPDNRHIFIPIVCELHSYNEIEGVSFKIKVKSRKTLPICDYTIGWVD